jgi:exodeoxyribonuclease VII small subunit
MARPPTNAGKGKEGSRQALGLEPPQGQPAEQDAAAGDLSFRQAQAALELCLAQLQASDLDVEAMADLYRRARGYAEHCETILNQVEQEVMCWDPEHPEQPPHVYAP